MSSEKLPAIQLYVGDWLKDPVSGCSLAAQGLWLRMMFLMHNSDRYGYLSCNGVAIPPEAIARRCSCDSQEQYTTLLAELERAGVPSITQGGIIYSRRMVRDAKKRSSNADRVAKHRSKSRNDNEDSNGDVTHDVTPKSQPASSSVSTSSSDIQRGFKKPSLEEVKLAAAKTGLSEPEAEKFFHFYESKGWKVGKDAMKSWPSALAGWKLRNQSNGGDTPPSKPESAQW